MMLAYNYNTYTYMYVGTGMYNYFALTFCCMSWRKCRALSTLSCLVQLNMTT